MDSAWNTFKDIVLEFINTHARLSGRTKLPWINITIKKWGNGKDIMTVPEQLKKLNTGLYTQTFQKLN